MVEEKKRRAAEEELEFAWIRAFVGGDESGFDRLVLRNKDRIFNLCYRLLGDYEEASDSAQETFVKVYRSLKNFRFSASFSTWLYAIAVNTCRNRLKSLEYRYRKRMVPIDPPGDAKAGDCSTEIEDPAPSPLTQLARKEQEALVQRAIEDLAKDSRIVVTLRDVEGLSYEEIAEVTGYNLGTVKSKLARARQQLRENLKGVI